DPTAFFVGFLDLENRKIYVYDEFYQHGMSNQAIYQKIADMGYQKERITADCAEPKSIDQLKTLGLRRIRASVKGPDSVRAGIQWIQDFEIIVHPRCVNFLTEISCYTWAVDRFGNRTNTPIDDFNHMMDAMRYALEDNIRKKKWLV
ncbi:MAG TPA: PBSX family phage terminase large subunit, partial [Ruminococcus sp.]|nr:PBSX family phage terminase large subunit [Ruminococcus sp.]